MKSEEDKELKAIIARRDPRYDGRFFFGVKTTGIFCRPICPANPKPENIVILKSAAQAERLGFRACRRCRPELAPGSRWLEGTATTVARALRLMQESNDEDFALPSLASTLGISDRHLRRLFLEHLGASPVAVWTSQRLHFAKQALEETQLPVSEIALAAGFRSLRRFNEAFKQAFHLTPSLYRSGERAPGGESGAELRLKLAIHEPYDWDSVCAYLARHAAQGIESVNDGSYRRFISQTQTQARGFGMIAARRDPDAAALDLTISNLPLKELRPVLQRVKRLFDVEHNPAHLSAALSARARGIRVPACYDPFETAISVILSQLVSTSHAKERLRKLIANFGTPLGSYAGEAVMQFPEPLYLSLADLKQIGLTATMSDAIRSFSAAVAEGSIRFQGEVDGDELKKRILSIRGIGPWTCELIAMRCLGDPRAFPSADLVLKRALDTAKQEEWSAFLPYLAHVLWREASAAASQQTQQRTQGVSDGL